MAFFSIIDNVLNPSLMVRLLFTFYRSTLALNWGFSLACSIVVFIQLPKVLPISLMTSGSLLSFYYKSLSRKGDYFFFYNRGISKTQLLTFTLMMNVVVGAILYFLLNHVSYS